MRRSSRSALRKRLSVRSVPAASFAKFVRRTEADELVQCAGECCVVRRARAFEHTRRTYTLTSLVVASRRDRKPGAHALSLTLVVLKTPFTFADTEADLAGGIERAPLDVVFRRRFLLARDLPPANPTMTMRCWIPDCVVLIQKLSEPVAMSGRGGGCGRVRQKLPAPIETKAALPEVATCPAIHNRRSQRRRCGVGQRARSASLLLLATAARPLLQSSVQ